MKKFILDWLPLMVVAPIGVALMMFLYHSVRIFK